MIYFKVIRQTREAQFQLLHLSILREYIEVDLALNCSWALDKERLIDDFIFMAAYRWSGSKHHFYTHVKMHFLFSPLL